MPRPGGADWWFHAVFTPVAQDFQTSLGIHMLGSGDTDSIVPSTWGMGRHVSLLPRFLNFVPEALFLEPLFPRALQSVAVAVVAVRFAAVLQDGYLDIAQHACPGSRRSSRLADKTSHFYTHRLVLYYDTIKNVPMRASNPKG